MLIAEQAHAIAKKVAFAKANGATQEQASKYCGHKVNDAVWNGIKHSTYKKSPKYKDGWIE